MNIVFDKLRMICSQQHCNMYVPKNPNNTFDYNMYMP